MKISLIFVYFAAAAAMTVSGCLGQDSQEQVDGARLLANLHASDPGTRYKAFQKVRSSPALLRDPSVRSALLDLLDQENRGFDAEIREGERKQLEHKNDIPESSDGNPRYIDDLLRTIKSFANFHDPHEICLLAKAGAMLSSPDARESATRAQMAMPCLQQLSRSDLFMDRLKAVKAFVELSSGAKDSLDSGTAEAIKQAVVFALHDKRTEVQWQAVDSLASHGSSDMIPALRELAESVPGPSATEDQIAVRKNAAKAILAIEQREGHQ